MVLGGYVGARVPAPRREVRVITCVPRRRRPPLKALPPCVGSAAPAAAAGHRAAAHPPSPPHPFRHSTRVCAGCGRTTSADGGRLRQCSRCRLTGKAPVFYCGQACATACWPLHRTVCSEGGLLP